jgi:hypothetical protein
MFSSTPGDGWNEMCPGTAGIAVSQTKLPAVSAGLDVQGIGMVTWVGAGEPGPVNSIVPAVLKKHGVPGGLALHSELGTFAAITHPVMSWLMWKGFVAC